MHASEPLEATIEDLELEAAQLARDGSEAALRTLRILRTYIDRLHRPAGRATADREMDRDAPSRRLPALMPGTPRSPSP